MVIYTMLAMTLINQTFALIYIIPEKIGRWIGLQADPADTSRLLQEIKGGIEPFTGMPLAAGKAAAEGMAGVGGVGKAGGAVGQIQGAQASPAAGTGGTGGGLGGASPAAGVVGGAGV